MGSFELDCDRLLAAGEHCGPVKQQDVTVGFIVVKKVESLEKDHDFVPNASHYLEAAAILDKNLDKEDILFTGTFTSTTQTAILEH